METTKCSSVDEWIKKILYTHTKAHTHSELLRSSKKKESPVTFYNMDEM